MKRGLKKGSAVYAYLQSTGLLEHGSTEEIITAKKWYWASLRKAWKKEHLKDYKSYTISFNAQEQRLLQRAAMKANCSINFFIKNACLHVVIGTPNIDKKNIGKIREALVLFYNDLQCLNEESSQRNDLIDTVINKFKILETTILSLLRNEQSNTSF